MSITYGSIVVSLPTLARQNRLSFEVRMATCAKVAALIGVCL